MTMPIQINGKLRETMQCDPKISKEEAIAKAKTLPNVAKYLEGKNVLKDILVPGKLVSFVVE